MWYDYSYSYLFITEVLNYIIQRYDAETSFFFFYLEWFILGSIFIAIIALCGTSKYSLISFIIFLAVIAYYFVINAKIHNITKAIIIVILLISVLPLLIYASCVTVYASDGIPLWSQLVADYSDYSNALEKTR